MMKDYSYADLQDDITISSMNQSLKGFYNAVLVRHGGEMGIKSHKTRKRMITLLNNEIYSKTKNFNVTSVKNVHTRTIVTGDNVDYVWLAQFIAHHISGVDSTSPIIFKPFSQKQSVIEFGSDYSCTFLKSNSSFGFKVRRTGSHDYTSMEMAKLLAERTFEKAKKLKIQDLKVNLTTPDFLFQVEIKYDSSFFFHQIFKGIDGLPSGSQGKLLAGIKPWQNDYLAAALMRRRGASIIPVKFVTDNKEQVDKQEKYFNNFLSKKELKNTIQIDLEGLFISEWRKKLKDEQLCAAC